MIFGITYQNAVWLVSAAIELVLIILMVVSKNRLAFPIFFSYVVIILLQSAALFWAYRTWGFHSVAAYRFAWISQGTVVVVRALVAGELCRRLLRAFTGIWALAWRLLLASAFIVLLVAVIFSEHLLSHWVLVLHRGVELSIAAIIVVLLAFARHYQVQPEPVVRSMALGLFLYSGFEVINNTVLALLSYSFGERWVLLGMLAFLASLVVWTAALRHPVPAESRQAVLLPGGVYQSLVPAMNVRLKELDDRLASFFGGQGSRP